MFEILYYIAKMDLLHHFTGWFVILFTVLLLIWHHVLVKKDNSAKAWKVWSVLCFVPLVVCAVHFYLNCYKGNELLSVKLYLSMYAGAFALIVLCILRKKKVLYKIAAVLTVMASVIGFGYAVFELLADYHLPHIGNYSRCGYVENFDRIMADMKKNYVLNDWKEIDYDKIRANLMPKVEEAEKNHDSKTYYKVLREYMILFDKDGLHGDGGNNGLLTSSDPFYVTNTSHAVPASSGTGFNRVQDLNGLMNDLKLQVANATSSSDVKISITEDNETSVRDIMKKAYPEAMFIEIPSLALNAGDGNGFVVVSDDCTTLHLTTEPTIKKQGENEEDEYYYANYITGSLQVTPDLEGAIIKQPITFA